MDVQKLEEELRKAGYHLVHLVKWIDDEYRGLYAYNLDYYLGNKVTYAPQWVSIEGSKAYLEEIGVFFDSLPYDFLSFFVIKRNHEFSRIPILTLESLKALNPPVVSFLSVIQRIDSLIMRGKDLKNISDSIVKRTRKEALLALDYLTTGKIEPEILDMDTDNLYQRLIERIPSLSMAMNTPSPAEEFSILRTAIKEALPACPNRFPADYQKRKEKILVSLRSLLG